MSAPLCVVCRERRQPVNGDICDPCSESEAASPEPPYIWAARRAWKFAAKKWAKRPRRKP